MSNDSEAARFSEWREWLAGALLPLFEEQGFCKHERCLAFDSLVVTNRQASDDYYSIVLTPIVCSVIFFQGMDSPLPEWNDFSGHFLLATDVGPSWVVLGNFLLADPKFPQDMLDAIIEHARPRSPRPNH